jgi:nickel/cobalt transporter (NicO) family protein
VICGVAAVVMLALDGATHALLAQNPFGGPRASADPQVGGALVMRGPEFAAAGLVLLFGIGLLFGYIAAERVTCL